MNKDLLFEIIGRGKVWDLANQKIYDLFQQHFMHKSDEEIIAKTWILGRTYAVALERRRKNDGDNNEFYTKYVTNLFKNNFLDKELELLKNLDINKEETIFRVLKLHNLLSEQIRKISGQNRSFSSKYLHFHLPNHFVIYDSIASSNLNKRLKNNIDYKKFREKFVCETEFDKNYFEFYIKCLYIKKTIKEKLEISLNNRQIDNLLLYISKDENIFD